MYADSTAVVGPLAPDVEPHCYDLCEAHAARLTAPRGWELVRIETEVDPVRRTEDLEAIATAVREERIVQGHERSNPHRIEAEDVTAEKSEPALADAIGEGIQRGHLRSVPGVLPGMEY